MSVTQRPVNVGWPCLPGSGWLGVCDGCDGPLPANRRRWCSNSCNWNYTVNHIWRFARAAAKRRDKYCCTQCGAGKPLEVDHIEAAKGQHKVPSCKHHVPNLRTLCVPCHKRRTREQRREPKQD